MDQRQQTHLSSPDEYRPEAGTLGDLHATFIQDVSQELRTPLTIIQGYAELLGDGSLGAVAPEQQEAVFVIANRACTVRALVERMGIFLEAETHAATSLPLALDEIIAEVVKGKRAAATQAGLTLGVHLEPDLPPVFGDPYHLQQAIDCLLDNAIRLTPDGGWVEVQTYTEAGWVCLAVTDTGTGMTGEELEHVFARLYQKDRVTTRWYEGSGLGLPLVRAIIEGHSGQIKATSLPNWGSRFTIKLPTPASAAQAAQPVEDAMASRPILVDDRRQAGITVQQRPFDPFITDYRTPDMDSMALSGPALFPYRTGVHLGQLRGIELDLKSDARQLLNELDQIAMSHTAYDTAWVARVPGAHGSSEPAFPEALDWLRRNQHPNGSWGAGIEYYHDLIISTLAAIIALARQRDGQQDANAIRRGENFVRRNIQNLHRDPYETVGFELILPALLQEARQLDLDLPYAQCSRYRRIREKKLRLIPSQLIYSRKATTAHSLELVGSGLDAALAADLQEENGSVGNSPSATAYFLAECQDNPAARRYLAEVVQDGAAVPAHPVEIFNKGWVLYNLDLAGMLSELREEAGGHLDSLYWAWDPHRGVGFSRQYSVPDLDDTAVVFKLLRQTGYKVNPAVFTAYEQDTHFICYPYERNPSVGVHVHLMDALHTCPDYEHQPRMLDKVLGFYRGQLRDGGWFDKWHVSPYYIMSHAIIATIGYDNELAGKMVNCLLHAQRQDGSWGYFDPTSEETAYCLQALIMYHREVELLDRAVFYHAAQYLHSQYQSQNHPPLWIEKCLYTPRHIVRSAIVSALWMYETL
jgi:halimadienyl-diphosphate synthase